MSQTEFIRKTYKKNTRNNKTWQFGASKPHNIAIRLQDFGVDAERVDFEADDFPYFRAALLDKHLEETDAEKYATK